MVMAPFADGKSCAWTLLISVTTAITDAPTISAVRTRMFFTGRLPGWMEAVYRRINYEIRIYRIAAASGRQLLREQPLQLSARDDGCHIEAAFVQCVQESADDFGARQVRARL